MNVRSWLKGQSNPPGDWVVVMEQYLDMGQSVLTPEEDLLGKVGEPVAGKTAVGALTRQRGKGNSGQDSETGSWGTSNCLYGWLAKRL
jgi:hypothetical protein